MNDNTKHDINSLNFSHGLSKRFPSVLKHLRIWTLNILPCNVLVVYNFAKIVNCVVCMSVYAALIL